MRRAKGSRAWALSGLRVLDPPGPCVCVVPPPPGQDKLSSPELRDGTAAGGPPGWNNTTSFTMRSRPCRAPPRQGVCLGGRVKGTRGKRGSCLHPHRNPCPRPDPQEQKQVNSGQVPETAGETPQDRDGRDGKPGCGREVCAVNTSSRM